MITLLLATTAFALDTDDDGIPDDVELYGQFDGSGNLLVDFPALGADPFHKDAFVDLAYEDVQGGRTAAFGDALIDEIAAIYAALPVSNPDGVDGIAVHVLPGVAFDRQGLGPGCATLRDDESFNGLPLRTLSGEYTYFAVACVDPGRKSAAQIGGTKLHINVRGVNRDPLDDATEPAQGGLLELFVHEFGHNLALAHGGDETANYKPNYPSSMSYRWQEGRYTNDPTLSAHDLGYSDGSLLGWPQDECEMLERYPFEGSGVSAMFLPNGWKIPVDVMEVGTLWGTDEWMADWDLDGAWATNPVLVDANGDCYIGDVFTDHDDHERIATAVGLSFPDKVVTVPYVHDATARHLNDKDDLDGDGDTAECLQITIQCRGSTRTFPWTPGGTPLRPFSRYDWQEDLLVAPPPGVGGGPDWCAAE